MTNEYKEFENFLKSYSPKHKDYNIGLSEYGGRVPISDNNKKLLEYIKGFDTSNPVQAELLGIAINILLVLVSIIFLIFFI